MSEDKTHTYPREIWLQSGASEFGEPMTGYDEVHPEDITWCWHPIEDDDLRYVRGDIADDMLAALRAVWEDVSSPDNESGLTLETGRKVKAAIAKAEGQSSDG